MKLTPVPPSPPKPTIQIAPINWTVKLLDLPVKLVLDIASLTQPQDLDNFVLTCKAIYEVTKASGLLQEHINLRRKYERWQISQNKNHTHIHPIELLCAIRKNPIILQYIRYVDLKPILPDPWEEHKGRWEAAKEELRRDGALREMLGDSYIMREAEQDIDAWHEAILGGKDEIDFSFVFLLTLLTHVTHLRLSQEWGYLEENDPDDSTINHSFNIDRVVYMFCDPRVQEQPNAPLSQLAVIEPWNSHEATGTPLQILAPFLALPSMRKIVVNQLEADHNEHDFDWPWGDSRPSPVEEIEFTSSAVSATQIERFLEPLKNLKAFRYSYGFFGDGGAGQWDGGEFVAALRRSPAAKTLEALSLAAENLASSSAISTFKGLDRLRDLELDISLLLGKAECGEGDLADRDINEDFDAYPINNGSVILVRLVDILPPTICSIKLLLHSIAPIGGRRVNDCQKLFNGLAGERDKLPNLKEVQLCAFWSEDSGISEQAMPQWLSDFIVRAPSVGIAFRYKQNRQPQLEHIARCYVSYRSRRRFQ